MDKGLVFWYPPKPGHFTALTLRDETWARPLGLGTLVHVPQETVEKITRRFNDYIERLLTTGRAEH